MLRYIYKRLLMAVAVLLILLVFLGTLVHLVPGDPVEIIVGPMASETFAAQVREEMGLDEPILQQLGTFALGAVQGDLGTDFVSRRPVTRMIGEVLPHTMILALSGLALSALVGLPLGVLAASRPNSWTDRIVAGLSISFITLPPYVAGLFLLLIFSLELDLLPALGAGSLADPLDYLSRLILPAVALALAWIGYLARIVRASMLDVIRADYIRTARALGLSETRILYVYALRSAVIPAVAVLGVGLGHLLGGAVFIEVIFSRPGLGSLFYDAIATRNFPVIRGAAMVVAVLFVVTNLLVDLSYRILDPRIRMEESEPA